MALDSEGFNVLKTVTRPQNEKRKQDLAVFHIYIFIDLHWYQSPCAYNYKHYTPFSTKPTNQPNIKRLVYCQYG